MWKTSLVPVIVIAIFLLLFYAPEIFRGQVMYCCDNALLTVPAKVFWKSWFTRGIFPLWNPFVLSGTPYAADINISPYYIGNVLYLISSPFSAVTLLVVLHAFLGAAGIFVIARQFGITRWGSVLSAIIFAGSGTVATYSGNVPMAQTASWIPWLMWASRRYSSTPTRQSMVLLISIAVQAIFSGHPQLLFYGFLLSMSYVFTFTKQFGVALRRLWVIVPFILALGAIQIFPFVEMAALSTRMDFGSEYTLFGSLPPWAFVRFIVPLVTGTVASGTSWWQGGSVYGYIGTLSFVIVLFGIIRDRRSFYLGLVVILSVLFALGSYTAISSFLITSIPGLSSFRVPAHFLLPYTIGMSLLVGLASEQLVRIERFSMLSRRFKWLGITITTGGIFLLALRSELWKLLEYAEYLPAKLIAKLGVLGEFGVSNIVIGVSVCLFITGGSLLILSDLYKAGKIRWIKIAVTLLVGLELILFSRGGITTTTERTVLSWLKISEATAAQLKEYLGNTKRIYTHPDLDPIPSPVPFGEPFMERETYWQAYYLRSNLAALYGIPSVQGYSSMVYRPYQQFYGRKATDPTGVAIPEMDTRLLGEASAGVLLHRSTGSCAWVPGESPPLSCIQIDLNAVAKPRISVSDQNGRLAIVHELPGYLIASVNSTGSNLLVFREVDYPGWQVFIDGIRVPHGTYAGVFMSVPVPEGQHIVTFWFNPSSVRIGTGLSFLGLMALWWLYIRMSVPKQKEYHGDAV